jgi:pimeloyl-ACP methyl ester carboxylesterase
VPLSPPTAGPVEQAILADLAPTFRERFVSSESGLLRVLEGGDGPPLVVVHGRGSASTMWLPLLPQLARTHRVLAIDLPGFGGSIGHRFPGGGFEAALAFFVDPVERWLLAERIEAPAILGHSLGGFVALELALRGRVKPRALALVAPLGVGAAVTLPARLFFQAGPERVARALGAAAFTRLLPHKGPHAERLTALSYELYAVEGGRPDASRAFDVLVPLAGPAPHRRERLGEIEAPTLVLWGEDDEALPSPLALGAVGALRRGVLRLVKGGHAPHQEDPEAALAMLGEVL